jgi:hypothetical protein
MKRIALLTLLLALLFSAGCDCYTTATRVTFDANAQYSRNIADAAAAGVKPDGTALTPADSAYYLECFARTFQNLSDAGHWKTPTYPKAPTTMPTTIPWNNKE